MGLGSFCMSDLNFKSISIILKALQAVSYIGFQNNAKQQQMYTHGGLQYPALVDERNHVVVKVHVVRVEKRRSNQAVELCVQGHPPHANENE